jgi:hypothetical protein
MQDHILGEMYDGHTDPLPPFGSLEYRTRFREDVGKRMSGTYYALTILITLAIIISTLGFFLVSHFSLYIVLLLPAYFLFDNLLEYILHRFPMHHKMKNFEMVYEHVTIHHNFYYGEHFYFEEPRDYYAAILPRYIFLGLTAVITVVSLILWPLFGLGHAVFFAMTAYSYYLLYELLHFSYHSPESSFLKKLPFVRRLSRQHILHHRSRDLANYNFNITFPIFDFVFGTRYKGKELELLAKEQNKDK